MVITKQLAQFIADNPAIVVVDLGNTGGKAILIYLDENGNVQMMEFTIPHGLMPLNEIQWRQETSTVKMGRGNLSKTHTFSYIAGPKDAPREYRVKFGKSAQLTGATTTKYGNAKYDEGYIDVYLTAMLCEIFPKALFPNGHNEILLAFGVPPSDWEMTPKLMKLLNKKHRIDDADGKRRTFNVKFAQAIDENSGGIIQAIATMDSERRNIVNGQYVKVKEGERIIAVDSGGFLGSMAWGEIDKEGLPVIDFSPNRIAAIDGGIISVRRLLRDALRFYFGDNVQGLNNAQMDDQWLDDIIVAGDMKISGKAIEEDERKKLVVAISESTGDYINNQMQGWTTMGSGKQAAHIFLMGGTTNPLLDKLKDVYKHGSIILAEKREEIYMANVRGFVHIFLSRLKKDGLLPETFIRGLKAINYYGV